jgi:hypothetical protein
VKLRSKSIQSKRLLSVRHRTAIGAAAGIAVLTYLVTINIAHGTPLLAVLLIVLVGAVSIPVGLIVTNLLLGKSED